MASDVNIWELITKPLVKAILDVRTARKVYRQNKEDGLDITRVDFSTKPIDPSNVILYDNGSYRLTVKVSFNDGVALAGGETIELNVYKNDILVCQDIVKGATTAANKITLRINDVLDIKNKDRLAFKIKNTGATNRSLEANKLHNLVIIERV
jgi:hypothetical protein